MEWLMALEIKIAKQWNLRFEDFDDPKSHKQTLIHLHGQEDKFTVLNKLNK